MNKKPEHITSFMNYILDNKKIDEENEKDFEENKEYLEWYFGGVKNNE